MMRQLEFNFRAHFANDFSVAIQIHFAFFLTSLKWLLQNFVHATTAVLSWHVQTFVEMWWTVIELQQYEFFMEFSLRAKTSYEISGPW